MRRIIEYFRRDPAWWLTLAIVTAAAIGFLAFVNTESRLAARPMDAEERAAAQMSPDEAAARVAAVAVVDFTPQGLSTAARAIYGQTVPIYVWQIGGRFNYGNGTIVRSGLVVTASHVLGPAGQPTFVICGDQRVRGEICYRNDAADLAILEVPGCAGAAVMTAAGEPNVDDVLYSTGFLPMENAYGKLYRQLATTSSVPQAKLVRYGIPGEDELFARIQTMERDGVRLPGVAGALRPGMSGSPIFNAGGQIVGMVSMVDNGRNRTFFIPAAIIARELAKAGIR